jgi:hypothetical protein
VNRKVLTAHDRRSEYPYRAAERLNTMSDEHELPKVLRDALAGMPAMIESGLSSPRTNAIDRLRWVGLAIRVFQGSDVEDQRKATQILKAAVPALENIRDKHQSERLRKAAAKYLEQIAREVS